MSTTHVSFPALALRSAVGAFLRRFDAFCSRAHRPEGGVSDALFGSARKVKDLRAGKGVGVYILAKAEERLAALAAEAGINLADAEPAAQHTHLAGAPGQPRAPAGALGGQGAGADEAPAPTPQARVRA